MEVYKPVFQIVMRECPGEIGIGIMVSGCPYGCRGCSYKSLEKFGRVELSLPVFEEELKKYQGNATTVVWMGGCWLKEELPEYLLRAKQYGYKNCLYTGNKTLGEVDKTILENLDFCKFGRWEGVPLTDPNSNQRFWDVKNDVDITYKFQTKGE